MLTNSAAIARVSRELHAVENAIDNAIGLEGALLATLTNVRSALHMPASAGHEAMMRLASAQQAMVKARGEMIRVHAELLSVAQEKMDLPIDECPDNNGMLEEAPSRAA